MGINCDFDGWVTKNDVVCSDGRIIRRDAFKDDDGAKVPLVFQHSHDDPSNVLGYIRLKNMPDGVYGYASFNNTQKAQDAKELVRHGDLDSLSIYANKLRQNGNNVLHGSIKEVSLVLAGANSGAKIQNLYFEHADGSTSVDNEEAIITLYKTIRFVEEGYVEHADKDVNDGNDGNDEPNEDDEPIEDIIETMNEKQKRVLYGLVAEALEAGKNSNDKNDAKHSDMEEDNSMKHNVFDAGTQSSDYIEHGEELRAKALELMSSDNRNKSSISSLGDALMHAAGEYGIDNIDFLFPDAKTLTNTPEFIKRDDDWVDSFMSGSKHSPFSRVKTIFADITADEARAKGYTKGNMKLEEVFELLKRSVEPTTIYKKQKLDRDDIIDITDFDVVVWLKIEMRKLLNEEIARAALIGDGRSGASNDKIKEANIIPIWKDSSLFTVPVKVTVADDATDDQRSEATLRAILKARKNYKGSGNPTWYTTEDVLTDLLLVEDGIGRRKYNTVEDVARAARVSKIVTVPVMENQTRTVTEGEGASAVTETRTLLGIIVNPIDYTFGSDKGGNVSMFDDFDIDYNQNKYLMETRCSGALTKPYSAMAVELVTASNAAG